MDGSYYPLLSAPAVEQDGSPVAQGIDWLQVYGAAAIVEGHISDEGLQHVIEALRREEVRR